MVNNKQGPVIHLWSCGCGVDHGIPTRCDKHKTTPPQYDFYNETGHRYGCECKECMNEYWELKK